MMLAFPTYSSIDEDTAWILRRIPNLEAMVEVTLIAGPGGHTRMSKHQLGRGVVAQVKIRLVTQGRLSRIGKGSARAVSPY